MKERLDISSASFYVHSIKNTITLGAGNSITTLHYASFIEKIFGHQLLYARGFILYNTEVLLCGMGNPMKQKYQLIDAINQSNLKQNVENEGQCLPTWTRKLVLIAEL
jgi:hypothetical protein